MVRAVWNGVVLAESNACEIVERNYYFPPDSINEEYFIKSPTHTAVSYTHLTLPTTPYV